MPGSTTSPSARNGKPSSRASKPIDPRTELTLAEQVTQYVDMWKKAVDVQQHFNDIAWRIRGLALTVATFSIGAAGVAAKDGAKVGWFSLGTLVLAVGLILWYAFYFVDRVWYHPLLKAAVEHGTLIESEIKKHLPSAGMTETITKGSQQDVGKIVGLITRKSTMQSKDKLVWFYTVGAAAFVISAVALQTGTALSEPQSPQQLDVRIVEPESSVPTLPTTSAPSAAPPTSEPSTEPATPRPS